MATRSKANPLTLDAAARALSCGETSSRALVEASLERVLDPMGEGSRAFVQVAADEARAAADAFDRLRAAGAHPGPYAGIPIGIKDLFDVAGQTTRAGSRVLAGRPPAAADAPAVARLRAAGFVILGRTNMTEFAYSGLGINPHYGTPANPWQRAERRIPGGSSSGAAVAIADGMVPLGLGSDTGGSCRIPAALCGVVGFKPTARRVPRHGAIPLSTSLDSVGPLANSVACCAAIDAIIADPSAEDDAQGSSAPTLSGLRAGLIGSYVTDGMDDTVATVFACALSTLSAAGVRLSEPELPELHEIPRINAKGGLVGAEAHAWHRPLVEQHAALYDPWILQRFDAGRAQSAADYLDVLDARRRIHRITHPKMRAVDVLLAPTVPIVAPRLGDLARPEISTRTNLLLLRNPALVNFLDGCAISIPIHRAGDAPVGLMLIGAPGQDRRLLAIAEQVEAAVLPLRG
jgi:aspartyl-tRNA(Asn)/glutamyl-tRNA(Gln) amidotransferase subunit A